MKGLIILMLIFSLFVNVNTDIFGWVSLYKMEFSDAVSQIKSMDYDFAFCLFWVMLLTSHLAIISLLFFIKKESFGELIVWVPLLYLISFILFNPLSVFLLLPFIAVWLVAITYQRTRTINIKIKTEILLLAMILSVIFAAIPRAGWSLSQFNVSLSAAILEIKAGKNVLWAVLWLSLMVSNVALISLFFLRKKQCFKELLLWIPALLIAIFIVYNYMAFFFLIPFIIIWEITLIKERNIDKWHLIKTSTILQRFS